MTREEEIYKAMESMRGLFGAYNKVKFMQGARWADSHPKSPWISVKDRLPKEGETVLLHTYDYGVITALYDVAWKGVEVPQLFYSADKARKVNECDYWCPIPELPKEGGEE